MPQLVIVCGLAGSGKTTVGKALARRLGAAFLDKDTLSRHFVEAMLASRDLSPGDRESDVYLNDIRPLEYRVLEKASNENLAVGLSVVVSAPYVRETQEKRYFQNLIDDADGADAATTAVWVYADGASMHEYLVLRNAERDEWKLNHWDEYLAEVDPERAPLWEHHRIDNSRHLAVPLKAQLADLVEAMR